MSTATAPTPAAPKSAEAPPAHGFELNLRTLLVGVAVAAFMGGSFPYVVLKLGFGPTVSVVSAFLGYLLLNLVTLRFLPGRRQHTNRWEFNIAQTAGTCASQSAFMCVLLAAFDLLASKPELGFRIQPTPVQVFIWLSLAGCLGVLMAVPLRRHYIDVEKLTFADGTAAGEALLILDEDPSRAKGRLTVLGLGALFSAVTTWFRDAVPKIVPEATMFGERLAKLNVGLSWSALSFGSGLIVGLRITLSMGLGMVLAWLVLPGPLHERGFTHEPTFQATLKWVMWPATGLMVSGGLTALVLKWKLIVKTFRELAAAKVGGASEFPLRWVGLGSAVLAVVLVTFQHFSLGVVWWESALALLISIPLMLVGIRVLGETNWAPISAMANLVQAIFAGISPGSIGVNMVASGMSGSVAGAGEQVMQDFRAGKIVGNHPRALTYMQLVAVPVGAAAVSLVYPLLKSQYGIGPDRYGIDPSRMAATSSGLISPISVKWAGFAELLMGGLSKLPPYSLEALVAAVVLGVAITVLEHKYKVLPSPTGVALGMLIPAVYVLPMVLGGIAQFVWKRARPKQEEEYNVPLASGLIVGEAMLALIIPILLYFGVLSSGGGGGH